jgi:hypothetical protein
VKTRAFWLTSLFLVIFAICFHLGGLNKASEGLRYRAKSVESTEQQKQEYKTAISHVVSQSDTLILLGLISAATSVVCLIVSYRKKEKVSRSVPIALLVFYLLLQLVVV